MNTIEIFPWNESFETGITEIDEQHRRLVQLINLLAKHLAYKSALPPLHSIFAELSDYAEFHFSTEESIWAQYFAGDDLCVEHQKKHFSFLDRLLGLVAEEHIKPLDEIVQDILSFLTHWLMFHILESDNRLALAALAIQSGLSLQEAKRFAEQETDTGKQALIKTVLSMYETLSSRNLQLLQEMLERQKIDTKLRLSANVFENTLDAICITDADANIIDINPAFCRISELSREKLLGKNLKVLMSGFNDQAFAASLWDMVTKKGHWSGEIQDCKPGGELQTEWLTLSSIRDNRGFISNYVAVFSNVSELLQRQQKLERIANHDPLTNLPNRILLMDRLDLAIAFAKRTGEMLVVCYIDLDGFKPINDHLGHDAGDKVLCAVSQRIKYIVRDNDTAARLGGDEFVILLGQIKSIEDCTVILDRLIDDIAQPIQIDSDYARVTASIGVALFPSDSIEASTLIKQADKAMYLAKGSGKSRYHFFGSTNP